MIPGGVNSPVRVFSLVDSPPVFITEGRGSHVFDVDGNVFIDYICSWGTLILGHAHPAMAEEIQKAIRDRSSFGLSTEIEVKMAKLICEIVPSIEITYGELRKRSCNECITFSKRIYKAAKN